MLGFPNAYVLAMRKDRAGELGIETIDDLRKHTPQFTIAGDLQFFERPEWSRVRDTYGLAFRSYKGMNPSLMYQAVMGKDVQVICAYSSDGRILAGDLVILRDNRGAFPPYDAILLLSPNAAARQDVRESLLPLIGAIDLPRMQRANLGVDVEGRTPRQAAGELGPTTDAGVNRSGPAGHFKDDKNSSESAACSADRSRSSSSGMSDFGCGSSRSTFAAGTRTSWSPAVPSTTSLAVFDFNRPTCTLPSVVSRA